MDMLRRTCRPRWPSQNPGRPDAKDWGVEIGQEPRRDRRGRRGLPALPIAGTALIGAIWLFEAADDGDKPAARPGLSTHATELAG